MRCLVENLQILVIYVEFPSAAECLTQDPGFLEALGRGVRGGPVRPRRSAELLFVPARGLPSERSKLSRAGACTISGDSEARQPRAACGLRTEQFRR